MQQLAGFPELAPGHRYERETYFVHGALSNHVRPVHKGTILSLFPKAKLIPIPNAAHWVHFDQPSRFIECVLACLETDTQ
jgi:pimeloyl-ACP methyl ester carboxylesterase